MKALLLSGGGMVGSFQAGAIKYLLTKQHKQYDLYAGTSVGSINALCLAQYKSGEYLEAARRLEDLWKQISNKKVKKFYFPPYLSALWKPGLYSTEPLKRFLTEHFEPERLAASGKLLRASAISLNTGKLKVFTEKDENIIEGMLASCAFPGILQAYTVGGEQYVDGGVRNILPLKEAIQAGATEIDVILTSPRGMPTANKKFKTIDILSRCFQIMMDEIIENDLRETERKNNIEGYKEIKLNIIRPLEQFNLNHLDFDPTLIRVLMEIGYNTAKGGR